MKKILFIWVLFIVLSSSVYAEDSGELIIPDHTVPVPNVECGQIIKSSIILNTNLNCPANGLVVGKSDITIDCNGKTIKYALSSNGYGVSNIGYDNVELKNCKIKTDSTYLYNSAIYFKDVKGISIKNNYVVAPNSIGIEGINFEGNIENNQVNAVNGIYAFGGDYISIKNNDVEISKASGMGISGSANNEAIVSGNNIQSEEDSTIGINFGGLNAKITENEIDVTGNGIDVGYCSGMTISNNDVEIDGLNGAGISMLEASDNEVYGNNVLTNGNEYMYGIKLWVVSDTIVENNIIDSEDSFALFLWDSHDNIINENEVVKAVEAVHMKPFDAHCNNNVISNNVFGDVSKYDLYLGRDGYGGSDNTQLINQEIRKYDIQSNIIVVENEEGKLEYLKPIAASGNDLDNDIEVMQNSISIEKDGLNKRARLTFKDLSIQNPIALMNGNVCPSDICGPVAQQGDDYSYTVEHFTEYSIGEDSNDGPKAVSCGDTLTSNTVLTSDLTCAGNGLILGANGITLDCNGHTIVYSQNEEGNGVTSIGYNNVKVENCNLVKGNWNGDDTFAIWFYNSDSSIAEYNNMSSNIPDSQGVSLYNSNGVIIRHNELDLIGTNNEGVYVSVSDNIEILSNQISSTGTNSYAVIISGDSQSNNISNNVINPASNGIYLYSVGTAPDNTFISNNELNDITSWDLLIDKYADDVILEDQEIEKYKIVQSSIIIKKTGIGEVWFNEQFTAEGTDLGMDVIIDDNNVSVDVINKPGFDVSGSIKLHNPSTQFVNPYYALMDGERCTAPYGDVCSNFENMGDVFSFDVTGMAKSFKIEGSTTPVESKKDSIKPEISVEKEVEKTENKVVKINKEETKKVEEKVIPSSKTKTPVALNSNKAFYSFYI